MAGSAVSWLGSTLVVCAALTACSSSPSDTSSSSTGASSDTSASSTTSSSPSSSAPSTTSAPTTSAATTTSAAPAGDHACGNHDLSVALGRSRAAAGHVGVAVVFHNVTHGSCRLYGYPGVAGLDSQGRQVTQGNRANNGYLGGSYTIRSVSVPAGGSASALVEGSDVPSGSGMCRTFSALLVTAPGTTASHVLRTSFPGCPTFQVHPVVPGTDGAA